MCVEIPRASIHNTFTAMCAPIFNLHFSANGSSASLPRHHGLLRTRDSLIGSANLSIYVILCEFYAFICILAYSCIYSRRRRYKYACARIYPRLYFYKFAGIYTHSRSYSCGFACIYLYSNSYLCVFVCMCTSEGVSRVWASSEMNKGWFGENLHPPLR